MESCSFVYRIIVNSVDSRFLKVMERKLFKVRHFQQTVVHTLQTNHNFLLSKGQFQFPFLLLCQLLQLDDISTFVHSTRNSLHIFILLCLSLPSSIPTKPLLRHLQRPLHNPLLIDPLRVPVHIALLFGPRSREITLRTLMNPQHALGHIDENAVLAQNVPHHVVIDQEASNHHRIHVFERHRAGENEIIGAAIVSNCAERRNEIDQVGFVALHGAEVDGFGRFEAPDSGADFVLE